MLKRGNADGVYNTTYIMVAVNHFPVLFVAQQVRFISTCTGTHIFIEVISVCKPILEFINVGFLDNSKSQY